ncbi:MAG: DinB family protein [Promethearchaeota archaeon]
MEFLKEYAIETFEIAFYNLLRTLEGVKPENVYRQVNSDINPIVWIVGHLAAHMDSKFVVEKQGKPLMGDYSWREGSPFTIGQSKETIEKGLPLTFKEVLDALLQIGEITFSYLHSLPEKMFGYHPGKTTSTMKRIQRVTLHIMGHMGQIRIIRRALLDPAPGFFVTGMSSSARDRILKRFNTWWNKSKSSFS